MPLFCIFVLFCFAFLKLIPGYFIFDPNVSGIFFSYFWSVNCYCIEIRLIMYLSVSFNLAKLISFKRFLVNSLGFSIHKVILSADRDSFTSFESGYLLFNFLVLRLWLEPAINC